MRQIARLLLEHGAAIGLQDCRDSTVLYGAVKKDDKVGEAVCRGDETAGV